VALLVVMENNHLIDVSRLVARDGAIEFANREGIMAPYRLSKEGSLDFFPPITECYIAIEKGDLLNAKKILNDLAALLVGSKTQCLEEVMLELKFRESRGLMLRQANRIRRAGANLKDRPESSK